MSKAAYAVLFTWLVEQINKTLAVGKVKSNTSLSILDIYGFECFKENSFEQLCINFANERLQQQFNKYNPKPSVTLLKSFSCMPCRADLEGKVLSKCAGGCNRLAFKFFCANFSLNNF